MQPLVRPRIRDRLRTRLALRVLAGSVAIRVSRTRLVVRRGTPMGETPTQRIAGMTNAGVHVFVSHLLLASGDARGSDACDSGARRPRESLYNPRLWEHQSSGD